MPFFDLAFGVKPIRQIISVLVPALTPKLMRSLGNLFLQTHIFIHVKNWLGDSRS